MAEGRVAQVVRQRDGFDQVLVQAQVAGDGARNLRHFQAMGEPGAEQVTFMVDEDLGLVLEPPEGRAMDDAVAVALELRARGRGRFGVYPPKCLRGAGGIGSEMAFEVGHAAIRSGVQPGGGTPPGRGCKA